MIFVLFLLNPYNVGTLFTPPPPSRLPSIKRYGLEAEIRNNVETTFTVLQPGPMRFKLHGHVSIMHCA